MSFNAVETTPKNCYAKGEGAVITLQLPDGSRNFAWVARALTVKQDRSKIMDFETVHQAIKANPISSTWRVSGELSIQCCSSSSQAQQKHSELPNCASCYQNIAKLLTHPCILRILECIKYTGSNQIYLTQNQFISKG